MFVVQDAIVRHDETQARIKFSKGLFFGKSSVIMRYYFCRINSNIDFISFLWMTLGILFGHLFRALSGSRVNFFSYFLGGLSGFILIFINFFFFQKSERACNKIRQTKRYFYLRGYKNLNESFCFPRLVRLI